MGFLIWAAVVLVLGIARLFYVHFFSPLSHIPSASVLAPVSRLLWEFPVEYRGQLTLSLPKLHKKLGPLVRIGPNQVSFYDIDIYKQVHKPGSAFVKDPRVYSQFVQDGHPALFSITDPKEHALRRRHMGLLFNRSRVPSLTHMMLEEISHFGEFLQLLHSRKEAVDLISTCRALEADIVSRFAFGNSIGAIDSFMVAGEELHIIKENDLQSSKMPVYTNFPSLVRGFQFAANLLPKVTGRDLPSVKSQKAFEKWANDQLELTLDPETASDLSFLKVMAAGGRIPEQCALSEAKEMLGPGTDTTSATLAHILWALSLNRSLQDGLVADLVAAQWPTDMAALESIPTLTACVMEGIRWTGAAAAMLPRIVPTAGAVLGGVQVPGGTMVSSSPIWYLRDENVFPEPHQFRPSRWLDKDDEALAALRSDYYVPFSKGASSCVGIHFAYLELYLSLSQILKLYCIKPLSTPVIDDVVDCEATLPPRREWVSAVPTCPLHVRLSARD
ncbi:benzoate 4-monooxygenase cytochrome p450 [Aspergillus pseudoustus]|uniref:Benzoate 4-monooxygenase cytochrome p450 n=1 Tax=Aspergillus pseudoustus TaxID=1810923 RepID=A0ABR4JHI2_9EURO